jgi:hypothetical protein
VDIHGSSARSSGPRPQASREEGVGFPARPFFLGAEYMMACFRVRMAGHYRAKSKRSLGSVAVLLSKAGGCDTSITTMWVDVHNLCCTRLCWALTFLRGELQRSYPAFRGHLVWPVDLVIRSISTRSSYCSVQGCVEVFFFRRCTWLRRRTGKEIDKQKLV